MSEESLRQQKMVANISTRSSGGWSTESCMFLIQKPMQPFVWTKWITSLLSECLHMVREERGNDGIQQYSETTVIRTPMRQIDVSCICSEVSLFQRLKYVHARVALGAGKGVVCTPVLSHNV